MYIYLSTSLHFPYLPRGATAAFYCNSMFSFLRNYQTLPQRLHHLIFPPIMYKGFSTFLTCPFSFSFSFLFKSYSHLCECELLPHCDFYLHILMINGVEHLFMCFLVTWMSLHKCLFKSCAQCLIRLSFCWVVFVPLGTWPLLLYDLLVFFLL